MNEPKNTWDLIKGFLWKYWVVIFIAAIVLIPILLNWVIQWQSFFEFVGKDTDWLMFWVTYISAIASFAMVFITWQTLKQSQVQLKELQYQFNETNRARLIFYITIQDAIIVLRIENIGNRIADNINIKFNQDFIDKLPFGSIRETFLELQNSPFCISHHTCKNCFISAVAKDNQIHVFKDGQLSSTEMALLTKELQNVRIRITGNYCNQYDIDEDISINDFVRKFVYFDDGLNKISKNLKEINKLIGKVTKTDGTR